MMKIVLLNYATPLQDDNGGQRWWHKSGSRWPATVRNRVTDGSEYFPWPFLLSYLASLLQEDGHTVVLLDGCLNKWDEEHMVEVVRGHAPDFVVFESSEQTESIDQATVARLADLAPVVLIGPNITEDRTDLLAWPGVHAAIPGEYLLPTRRFFSNPVAGMGHREELIGTASMDALPPPLLLRTHYPRYNARFKTTPQGIQGVFVSMWGCQYRCNFCIWIHAWWAKSSQFQKQFSVDRLSDDLDRIRHEFPATTSFYDDADNHAYRRKDAESFAEMIGRKGLPWAILTRADTYVTSDGSIDRDMWAYYREAGLYAVKIGVEGVQESMDASNKRLDESVVQEFVPMMQDLGISVYCSFMLGVPNTSNGSDAATMNFISDLADYRPGLFEYFVSYCDVTQVTPFANDPSVPSRRTDGQLAIEVLSRAKPEVQRPARLAPNNLS